MNNISCIVVNKNSADKLVGCLTSVKDFADEIIVIDLESTDNSKQIAEKFHARFVPHKTVAVVEEVRQESFKLARHDYILLLDPDERITPSLKNELKKQVQQHIDFVEIPRKNIIFNTWVKHSRWWPDYQIRFFKKDKLTWPTAIHSQPVTDGKGVMLNAAEELAIDHYNYDNLTDYLTKNIRYAQTEAAQYVQNKHRLTLKVTVDKALHEFFSRFFAGHGYRDGMHGFALAFLQMTYYFLVYFYYWEQKKYETDNQEDINSNITRYFADGLKNSLHWRNKTEKKGLIARVAARITSTLLRFV